jgi:signal transduction histidine kinase
VRDDGVIRRARRDEADGRNTSLGLQGMQERAASLGGTVEISSKPGHGVEVLASFPIQ